MNKLLIVCLISFTCLFSCKKKDDAVIADITKTTADINKHLKDYRVKHSDDFTSGVGAYITGYYREGEVKKFVTDHFGGNDEDGEIRKINTARFGENSRTFAEYYFDGGKVIYIIKQEFTYNKPKSYTEELAKANNDSVWYDDKKTKLEEYHYYFNDNKLIKLTTGDNKPLSISESNIKDQESELWAQAKILIKELAEN